MHKKSPIIREIFLLLCYTGSCRSCRYSRFYWKISDLIECEEALSCIADHDTREEFRIIGCVIFIYCILDSCEVIVLLCSSFFGYRLQHSVVTLSLLLSSSYWCEFTTSILLITLVVCTRYSDELCRSLEFS
jgi:hypothetical protein